MIIDWYVDIDVVGGAGDGTSWADAYSSLSAFEAAEAVDLVSAGNIYHVHCRASSGTDDTTGTTFDSGSWNTDSSNYVIIESEDAPQGVWTEANYSLEGAAYVNGLVIQIAGTQVLGLQVSAGTSRDGIYIDAAGCLVHNNIVANTGRDGIVAYTNATTTRISNNIVYDAGDGGIYINNPDNTVEVYNNTVIGAAGNGIESNYANNNTFRNNLIQASGGSDWVETNSTGLTTSKNITEDSTGPDVDYDDTDVHTNSIFTNYAGKDFTLDSGGDSTNLAIADDGDDLSGTFTDDIEEQTRSTWYIGASEIVSAGGSATPLLVGGCMGSPMGSNCNLMTG